MAKAALNKKADLEGSCHHFLGQGQSYSCFFTLFHLVSLDFTILKDRWVLFMYVDVLQNHPEQFETLDPGHQAT